MREDTGMYLIQERYRDGEWADTLPVLATRHDAETHLGEAEAMAAPQYSYRIAEATGLYALEWPPDPFADGDG